MERVVALRVNGESRSAPCRPATLLVHFLREQLGLTGTHVGCDTSSCGACTVLLDGNPIKSCNMLAVQAEGRDVETVEGLASGDALSPLQEAFTSLYALQCGFCTPGFLMAATALTRSASSLDEEGVRKALSGNLCRCTGYQHIVDAVLTVWEASP